MSAKLTIDTDVLKQSKKRIPIEEALARLEDEIAEKCDDGEGEPSEQGFGKIYKIIRLYNMGYTRSEIVKVGFNRSTVYRQTGEFKELKTGNRRTMCGIELYEARIERIMRIRKIAREEAIQVIADKDLELE